jgi:hypothetical protein
MIDAMKNHAIANNRAGRIGPAIVASAASGHQSRRPRHWLGCCRQAAV